MKPKSTAAGLGKRACAVRSSAPRRRQLVAAGSLSAFLLIAGWAGATDVVAAELYVDARSAHGPCSDNRTRHSAHSRGRSFCSIEAALRRARGGDAVYVAPGEYRRVRIRNVHPGRRITLDGASGRMGALQAKIEFMDLRNSSDLRVTGFRFTRRLSMRDVSDVRVRRNTFRNGTLDAHRNRRLMIDDNGFTRTADASTRPRTPGTPACRPKCPASVDVRDSSKVSVINNGFGALRADAIRLSGVQGAKVDRNNITGQPSEEPRVPSHAVRLLTPTRDVRISANIMKQTRGIFSDISSRTPAAHIGLEIVNNKLTDMDDWAMNLHAAPGVRIINNTAWQGDSGVILAEEKGYRDRTRSAVLINNVFEHLAAPADALAVEDYNLIAEGYRSGPHDVAAAPQFFGSPTCPMPCGFTLLPSSPGIDAATSRRFDIEVRVYNGRQRGRTFRYTAVAPERDINSKRRHDLVATNTGDGPVPFIDMGAHEADGRNP